MFNQPGAVKYCLYNAKSKIDRTVRQFAKVLQKQEQQTIIYNKLERMKRKGIVDFGVNRGQFGRNP